MRFWLLRDGRASPIKGEERCSRLSSLGMTDGQAGLRPTHRAAGPAVSRESAGSADDGRWSRARRAWTARVVLTLPGLWDGHLGGEKIQLVQRAVGVLAGAIGVI